MRMWSVVYTADAIKALSRMDMAVAKRIRSKILALAQDPTAPNNNVKKLTGVAGYRLRVGDWRVIYTLAHRTLTVIVVKVGHRSEVYE
jgi:mRNA interferase RelE/StbE